MSKHYTKTLLASAILASLATLPAHAAETPEFSFGGYVKLDAFMTDYGDGAAPDSGNLGRQLYVPSLTPVGGNGDDAVSDFHARQSRLFMDVTQQLSNGETVAAHVEIDFLTMPLGNERVSSSYAPRIRQAYIKYGNWTVGQAWSNFMNLSTLPESVDFIGTTDGVAFNRQPLIKYSDGGWSFSIENPETTVTPNGGGGRITSSDGVMPDFTAKYTGKTGDLSFSVAALLRQLAYDVDSNNSDETTGGYGVSLSAKYMLGDDDIRASITMGSGLGRYLGLNTFNDAVIDANGELEAIDVMGVTLAYRHVWSETSRSSFTYSRGWADNDTALIGTGTTESTQRLGVNYMYSPDKALTFGVEVSQATRELDSGTDGDMTRLHFMAMYKF